MSEATTFLAIDDLLRRLLPQGGESYYESLALLHQQSPIQQVDHGGREWILLYGFDGVRDVLSHPDQFSSSVKDELFRFFVGGQSLTCLDGYEHSSERSAMAWAFAGKVVRESKNGIMSSVADQCVEEIATDQSKEIDLTKSVILDFPVRVLAEVLGVPEALRSEFDQRCSQIIRIETDFRSAVRGVGGIQRLVTRLVHQSSYSKPGTLLAGIAERIDSGEVSEESAIAFVRLLVPAGVETTFRALGTVLCYIMGENGGGWGAYRTGAMGLDRFVDEVLRLESPLQVVPRIARESRMIGDVEVSEGSMVLCHIGAANRDRMVFADPDSIILDRRVSHVAFGAGPHSCLGANLAKWEIVTLCEALFRGFPNLHYASKDDPRKNISGFLSRSPVRLEVALQ